MPSVQQVSCSVKDAFPSRRLAAAVVRKQQAHAESVGKRRPPLSVFRCGFCDRWHVGGVDTDRARHTRRGEF